MTSLQFAMYLYRFLYLLSILLGATAVLHVVPSGADLIEETLPLTVQVGHPTTIVSLFVSAGLTLLFARALQLLVEIRGQLLAVQDRVSDLGDYPLF